MWVLVWVCGWAVCKCAYFLLVWLSFSQMTRTTRIKTWLDSTSVRISKAVDNKTSAKRTNKQLALMPLIQASHHKINKTYYTDFNTIDVFRLYLYSKHAQNSLDGHCAFFNLLIIIIITKDYHHHYYHYCFKWIVISIIIKIYALI